MLSGFNPFMNVATQRCHSKMTTGTPEVHPIRSSRTKISSSQLFTPSVDRDQTVSQRSKPNSRTTLIGEQPNPWDLLQPQDVMSRHRGAKLRRRCERLGGISLLSLGYLLSFKRWRFHFLPPDHLGLLSHLLDLYVSQLSFLIPIRSLARLPTGPRKPSRSSVTL